LYKNYFRKNGESEIKKTWDFSLKKAENNENEYAFEGIASSYGNVDCYGDIFMEGSLDENIGKTVAIMPNHSWDILKAIGSGKLGKNGKLITIEGEFIKDDELSEKIVKLKKAGVPIKMSIGGRILESKIVSKDGKSYRGITKAEIIEVSVVFQGANPKAAITKNEGEDMNKEQILKMLGITEENLDSLKKSDEKKYDEMVKKIDELVAKGVAEPKKAEIEKGAKAGNADFTKSMEEMKKSYDETIAKMEEKILDMQKNYTGKGEGKEIKKFKEELNVYVKTGTVGEVIKKALNTDPSSGGVLLPTNEQKEIIKEVFETSPVVNMARNYTIGKGNSLKVRVKVKGTNNAASQAEGAERGELSGSTYKYLTIDVAKITDAQEITTEMIEDAEFNALAEVLEDSRENIALTVSDRVWNGVIGADQAIEGIYTNTDVTDNAQETMTASTVTWEDLMDMIYKTDKNIRKRSSFLVSTDLLSEMRKWKDSTGQPLYVAPLTAGEPGMFGGYKVIEDSEMDDVADGKFPAFFGDMRKFYAFLKRKNITIERERNSSKDLWETYIRTRLGGKVRQPSQGKLLKVKNL